MNHKLKLNVEDLTVRSFETTPVNHEGGTVQGREMYTEYTLCPGTSRCCKTRNTCTTELC